MPFPGAFVLPVPGAFVLLSTSVPGAFVLLPFPGALVPFDDDRDVLNSTHSSKTITSPVIGLMHVFLGPTELSFRRSRKTGFNMSFKSSKIAW